MGNQANNGGVGDRKSPPLMATEAGLRYGAEQANKIYADNAKPVSNCSALSELERKKGSNSEFSKKFSCRQTLWFSIFFDGTGNNLEADMGFLKHSNIAKLYRARVEEDEEKGIYPIYIPGVATFFPEIGDDGDGLPEKIAGAGGEARMNYALMQMDQRMRRHLQLAKAPSNAINEINVAVFGFSRGASLARAFVNKLVDTRCRLVKGKFTYLNGNWPVRIRFMGLFDTVASVGKPMSSNTIEKYAAARSDVPRMIAQRFDDFQLTSPQSLAFAEHGLPGADPAPGMADGHIGYGNMLAIHEAVEEVRHFIAAHEMRNSFPVDSISTLRDGRIVKPAHFHETVYPGVHSDVGGSYAPGEGGKGATESEKYGIVPLTHMYQYALRAGVPLKNPGAWDKTSKSDFLADQAMTATYDAYLKTISSGTLGQVMNNHMQHYYAWRFRAIRIKQGGSNSEAKEIAAASSKFKAAAVPIDGNLKKLQADVRAADIHVAELQKQIEEHEAVTETDYGRASLKRLRADIESARVRYDAARQAMLKEKSRKDSLPDMAKFQTLVDLYDRQLVLDARAILDVLAKRPARADKRPPFTRADLRPHYRVLVEAYEAEFVHRKGLTDKTVIHFFDEYIHDSLSGFGADATIPSDPRVVYLGGDQKFAYASRENDEGDLRVA
jgi:hypothetical protein